MDVRDIYLSAGSEAFDWHRPGYPKADRFQYIELRARPSDEGLHESGYRFLALTGCWYEQEENMTERGDLKRQDLHQWSDHIVFYGPVNIDVEPDGTIRISPWGTNTWKSDDAFYASSAMFHPSDPEKAIRFMEITNDSR